jgi:hypothetical protein
MKHPLEHNVKPTALVFALSLLLPMTAYASPDQASQILRLSEHRRIEASICGTSMNRIAVSNDRITQLFGDEGTFESQNDETTGQVFLKPVPENGSRSLSLTLITEQGVTQDLTLTPDAQSARTLILKRDPAEQGAASEQMNNRSVSHPDPLKPLTPHFWPGHTDTHVTDIHVQDGSRPAQLLILLKQIINGQRSASEEAFLETDRPLPQGFALVFSRMWKGGAYTVHAIRVENLTDDPLPFQEKDFYQPGDLAISFGATHPGMLEPRAEATLYVVRDVVREEVNPS